MKILRNIPHIFITLACLSGLVGVLFLWILGYAGTLEVAGSWFGRENSLGELVSETRFSFLRWGASLGLLLSLGILALAWRKRERLETIWADTVSLIIEPLSIWRKIPLQSKVYLLGGLSLVLILKVLFISQMPLSGDEAAFFYTHVRRGPLLPLLYLNNHPLHLFFSSILFKAGLSDAIALRLPSVLATISLSLFSFLWFWKQEKKTGAWFMAFSIQFGGTLLMYSLDGKSYLLALLFLVCGVFTIIPNFFGKVSQQPGSKILAYFFILLSLFSNPGFVFPVFGILIGLWLFLAFEKNLKEISDHLPYQIVMFGLAGLLYLPALLLNMGGYWAGVAQAEKLGFVEWFSEYFFHLGWVIPTSSDFAYYKWIEIPAMVIVAFYAFRKALQLKEKMIPLLFLFSFLGMTAAFLSGTQPPARIFIFIPFIFCIYLAYLLPDKMSGRNKYLTGIGIFFVLSLMFNVKPLLELVPQRIQEQREMEELVDYLQLNAADELIVLQSWQYETLLAYYSLPEGNGDLEMKVSRDFIPFEPGFYVLDKSLPSPFLGKMNVKVIKNRDHWQLVQID